ncbi:MAG: pyridoxal phosphate-dependent aminotransferase [Thermoplasmatota archaeon]
MVDNPAVDRMFFDFPAFKHVEWIVDRPSPAYDMAWSNIAPKWKGVIDADLDHSLLAGSKSTGEQRLVEHLSAEYGVDPSQVMLTNGCSEANFLAYISILGRGSKVLIEKPIYTPLLEIPRAMGCEVHTIKRRPDDYLLDINELKEKVESLKPDLLVLQNLNNPSGKGLPADQLEDVAKILDKRNIPVLVDEVYRDFAITFSAGEQIHAFPSMSEIYDRSIITSSVTKVYGGGGLVTGWLIGPKRVINKARRQKIFTVPMVSSIGNRMALSMLKRRQEVLPAEFDSVREKLNLVSAWAKGRGDVRWSEPDGCAVGFLRYDLDVPSREFCERLFMERGVKVIPGEFFHIEKGFRFSVSASYDKVKGALTEIDSFLDSLG